MILLIVRIDVATNCSVQYNNKHPIGANAGLLYYVEDDQGIVNYLQVSNPANFKQILQVNACPNKQQYLIARSVEQLTVDCPPFI